MLKATTFAKPITELVLDFRLWSTFRFKVSSGDLENAWKLELVANNFYNWIFSTAPPQFEIKFRNQTARRGEPAILQCEAKGEKPIGILWSRDGKRLDPKADPRYTIREEILSNGVVSDLSVKLSERTDTALFTCVATNAFGSDETSINLIVQGIKKEILHLSTWIL